MDWAETYGTQLYKYADPFFDAVEKQLYGARKITLDDAVYIAQEDPELIWTIAGDLPDK